MTAERSPSAGSNPSPEHYHSSHHPSWLEQRSWASTVEISTTLLIRSHGYIPICWEAFSAVLVHVVLVPKSLFKLIIFPGIKWILSACQTAYPRILAMSGNSRDNLSTDKHQSSKILTLWYYLEKIHHSFLLACNIQIVVAWHFKRLIRFVNYVDI